MNTSTDSSFHGRNYFRQTFLLSIAAMTIFLVIVLTIIAAILHANDLRTYESQEQIDINYLKTSIERSMEFMFADVLMFAEIPYLTSYLNNPTPNNRSLLKNAYLCAGRRRFLYDQIRYIDEHGQEIIRLQKQNNDFFLISDDELQNKSDRYYFQNTKNIPSGSIYISPFDLNIEHDIVEDKPMIRFATSVHDSSGVFRGIVILNYLGRYLLDFFHDSPDASIHYWLVNDEGSWLRSHVDQDEWGFMYDGRKHVTLQNRYPELWNIMTQASEGLHRNSDGLFTFASVHPLRITSTESYQFDSDVKWYLISWVPESTIRAGLFSILKPLVALAVMFEFFALLSAVLFAHASARKQATQDLLEIAAATDPLTGLLNRRTFTERYNYEHLRSLRYEQPFSIAIGDIDLFKGINDSYGHQVGDEVLRGIAALSRSAFRSSDSIGRWGGEEFVFLFPDTNKEQAISAIEKYRQKIEQTAFITSQPDVQITMSFGVTSYLPNDTFESIIKRADKALYTSKKDGRNRITGV